MQNRLERWSHLNMALIGGFIGGYAIVNHHDLLGSAQTGNMIALALYVGGMHTIDWLVRLLGMVIYMLGIAIAVLLPKKIESIKLKRFSILLDMAALLTVGFLPGKTDHFVAFHYSWQVPCSCALFQVRMVLHVLQYFQRIISDNAHHPLWNIFAATTGRRCAKENFMGKCCFVFIWAQPFLIPQARQWD